ncbi:hypothetical protein MRQ86_00380 [Streptomyces sp. MMS21 TC-5]|uniref:hypothetical protein n=1 Tax=Streptomyces sp. MMS21 TC-5 TaxID=2925833 RepID=UPI001F607599|nr:hypothetical protein [Streptomyces sp. MMS21 TC-5]MCI4078835.1 hypothetical protein [Streptomyces sp. MMS21 TC-5]
MAHRTLKLVTVATAAAAALLSGTTASAATGVPWATAHSSATASGTRWLEKGGSILTSTLTVQGEMKNTGPGCFSLWSTTVHDFAPTPARKIATQCGPGTTPVNFKVHYAPTTTSSVYVCKDGAAQDCGQRTSITHWPIQQPVAPAPGTR